MGFERDTGISTLVDIFYKNNLAYKNDVVFGQKWFCKYYIYRRNIINRETLHKCVALELKFIRYK